MPGNKEKRLRKLKLSTHNGRWNIDFMIEEKLVEGRLPFLDEFAERLVVLQEDAPECLVVFLERLAFENEKNDNYSGQFDCRRLLDGLDIAGYMNMSKLVLHLVACDLERNRYLISEGTSPFELVWSYAF